MRHLLFRGRRPAAVLAAMAGGVLFCVTAVGCRSAGHGEAISQEDIRRALRADLKQVEAELLADFETQRAALAAAQGADPDAIRLLDTWQAAQKYRFDVALSQRDPVMQLVDAWGIVEVLAHHLQRPPGEQGMAAGQREPALEALQRARERISELARQYQPRKWRDIEKQVVRYASENQLSDAEALETDSSKWSKPFLSVYESGSRTFSRIFGTPLRPFRGIAEGGEALGGIRDATADAVRVAEGLPGKIRSEMEALFASIMERRDELASLLEQVRTAAADLRVLSENWRAAAQETDQSLERAERMVPAASNLVAGVERAARASTELTRAIVTMRESFSGDPDAAGAPGAPAGEQHGFDIREYETTARAIGEAAQAVEAAVTGIRALAEPKTAPGDGSRPAGRPFDVREYESAARAIGEAAAELRSGVDALRQALSEAGSEEGAARLSAAAAGAAAEAAAGVRTVADHVFWRALQLLLAAFALAALFTWWRRRLPARP
jgi:hypothetical protein